MIHYLGVKLIAAKPMTRLAYNTLRGWDVPVDENPDDEGYLVEYMDGGKANHKDFTGYISWSPKDVFERAYRPTHGLTFGLAVEALKQGRRVSRRGWNGSGMFIYYVPPGAYPARTEAAKDHFGSDALVPYRDYIAMKTVNEEVVPWVASQTDILATDWEVV